MCGFVGTRGSGNPEMEWHSGAKQLISLLRVAPGMKCPLRAQTWGTVRDQYKENEECKDCEEVWKA